MSNTRDDDVGRQYNVFQHQHQVIVAQRPHDAGQRSDLEQRSDMRQQHASQLQRSDVGHQLKVGQRANTDQRSDISGARQHTLSLIHI